MKKAISNFIDKTVARLAYVGLIAFMAAPVLFFLNICAHVIYLEIVR